jgi:hypothetical protein
MKLNALIVLLACTLASQVIYAQAREEVKSEIRKEVKLEEENGEKVLTIRTSSNGTETVEVYRGEEADKKLQELQVNEAPGKVREEVNGEKVIRIDRTVDGKTTREEYRGAEADQKLKEINTDAAPKKVKGSPLNKKEIKRIEVNQN